MHAFHVLHHNVIQTLRLRKFITTCMYIFVVALIKILLYWNHAIIHTHLTAIVDFTIIINNRIINVTGTSIVIMQRMSIVH